MYFSVDRFLKSVGAETAQRAPPIGRGLKLGLAMGAGADAHRGMSYNPFVALRWMLDGKTVAGTAPRGSDEIPNRLDTLRLYTAGSAWFAKDAERSTLEPGRLADLAVLEHNHLTIPVGEIAQLSSNDGRRPNRLRRRSLRRARGQVNRISPGGII